jgi:hypothetical protein
MWQVAYSVPSGLKPERAAEISWCSFEERPKSLEVSDVKIGIRKSFTFYTNRRET